jgi:hypothetical protein
MMNEFNKQQQATSNKQEKRRRGEGRGGVLYYLCVSLRLSASPPLRVYGLFHSTFTRQKRPALRQRRARLGTVLYCTWVAV